MLGRSCICHVSPQSISQDLRFIVQFSSVVQWCPTLCDPMDYRTPGFPVHHQLPKIAQTHVHWVGDAIQPSHPLLPPYPPSIQPSIQPRSRVFCNESLLRIRWLQSIAASTSASVLPMNSQGWFPLVLTGLISLQSKGLSRVCSNTTIQKHQFFSVQLSSQFNSHIHTWPLEKP